MNPQLSLSYLRNERKKVDWTRYDPAVLNQALYEAMGGTLVITGNKQPGEEATELCRLINSDPRNLLDALTHRSSCKNKLSTSVTPFTLVDAVRTEIQPLLVSVSNAVAAEKIVVSHPTGDVPLVTNLSLPDPQAFKEALPSVSPYDFQLANLSYYVGCYTKIVNGEVSAGINVAVLDKMKLPHLTLSSVLAFTGFVSGVVKHMNRRASTHHGVEWADQFYLWMTKFESADRIAAVVRGFEVILDPIIRSKKLEGLRPLKQSELDLVPGTKGARLQTSNIPCPLHYPKEFGPEQASEQLELSRQFRGRDDRGLSGMTIGAYTGEVITKASATVRDLVAIIDQEDISRYEDVYITGVSVSTALHLQSNFTRPLKFESLKGMQPCIKLTHRVLYPNKKKGIVFDFSNKDVGTRPKTMSFASYCAEMSDSISAHMKQLSLSGAERCVMRHKAFLIPKDKGIWVRVPPSPHNCIQTFVSGGDPSHDKWKVDPEILSELSIRANIFRDNFPFHRKKVWGLIEDKMKVSSPLVPYRLAQPQKVASATLQMELLKSGVPSEIDESITGWDEIFEDPPPQNLSQVVDQLLEEIAPDDQI